jgi:hypothetical protein
VNCTGFFPYISAILSRNSRIVCQVLDTQSECKCVALACGVRNNRSPTTANFGRRTQLVFRSVGVMRHCLSPRRLMALSLRFISERCIKLNSHWESCIGTIFPNLRARNSDHGLVSDTPTFGPSRPRRGAVLRCVSGRTHGSAFSFTRRRKLVGSIDSTWVELESKIFSNDGV